MEKRIPIDIELIRKKTMSYPIFFWNKEVDKMNEAIETAANQGLCYVRIYGFVPSKEIRKKFEDAGYTIDIFYGSMPNNKDSNTLIKW